MSLTQDLPLYNLCLLRDNGPGSHEFLTMLSRVFVSTNPAISRQMQEAALQQEWDTVSKLAHKLKAAIVTMRIESIREEIKTIELNAKAKIDLPDTIILIDKVTEVLEEVASQLQMEFKL